MPLLLNEPLAAEIERNLASGAFIDEVAEAVGIHRGRIFEWIAKGKRAQVKQDAGEDLTANELLFADFAARVGKARGRSKVLAHATIRSAMTKEDAPWSVRLNAAIFYLEKTNPNRYGRWSRTADEVPGAEEVEGIPEVDDDDAEMEQVVVHLERAIAERRAREAAEGNGQAVAGG